MITRHSIPDVTSAPLRHTRTPIVIPYAAPARSRPVGQAVTLASLILIALGLMMLPGQPGAVLCALGCAGVIAMVYRPTKVKTTDRVYTIRKFGRIWRFYGDTETDQWFDQR